MVFNGEKPCLNNWNYALVALLENQITCKLMNGTMNVRIHVYKEENTEELMERHNKITECCQDMSIKNNVFLRCRLQWHSMFFELFESQETMTDLWVFPNCISIFLLFPQDFYHKMLLRFKIIAIAGQEVSPALQANTSADKKACLFRENDLLPVAEMNTNAHH